MVETEQNLKTLPGIATREGLCMLFFSISVPVIPLLGNVTLGIVRGMRTHGR